jgi:sulfur-carrier protein adenylyltransferase/sulfurtransferase
MNIPEITVIELKARMDEGRTPFLLDVRRPEELAIANLGGRLIPLAELPERLDELESLKDEEIVVYCRSGARSGQAVAFLHSVGFSNARNLKGGIIAWSREIDPSMQAY